jgi:hypothetical protein
VLVEHRLARQVVPAPDEHDRRQAEPSRHLDHVRLGASEAAARDEQDPIGLQAGHRILELGLGLDQPLDVAESLPQPGVLGARKRWGLLGRA